MTLILLSAPDTYASEVLLSYKKSQSLFLLRVWETLLRVSMPGVRLKWCPSLDQPSCPGRPLGRTRNLHDSNRTRNNYSHGRDAATRVPLTSEAAALSKTRQRLPRTPSNSFSQTSARWSRMLLLLGNSNAFSRAGFLSRVLAGVPLFL